MVVERDFVLASRYLYQRLPENLAQDPHQTVLNALEFLASVFTACRSSDCVLRRLLQRVTLECFPDFMEFMRAECVRLGVTLSREFFQVESRLDLAPFNSNMLHFQVFIPAGICF